jgi:glycosyltransferase involved in cell wall biosynthesis
VREMAESDPNICFLGAVDENMLEELYSNCRAYVLPSEVEGMSLSLLDALAFGACNICSDIPANIEVVGDTGLPFKCGNIVDLRDKLEQVARNDKQVETLRAAARERMRTELSWDGIAGQWEQLYREVATMH